MARTTQQHLSRQQLEAWIGSRTKKELQSLAEIIGQHVPPTAVMDALLRVACEVPAKPAKLSPLDQLYVGIMQAMMAQPGSFVGQLQRTASFAISAAVDQQSRRIESKRPPADMLLCAKVYYLRFYRRLSFEQIRRKLQLTMTADGVEKLFRRTKCRITTGECGQYERQLLAFTTEHGIGNLDKFTYRTDQSGGDG
jgi:hypothetical protein